MGTINKLNPHMPSSSGIEPGPHWLEESAFTTIPVPCSFKEKVELVPLSPCLHVCGNVFSMNRGHWKASTTPKESGGKERTKQKKTNNNNK